MRKQALFYSLLSLYLSVSAVQLDIKLGQVETASTLGNLTLYPLDIRADVLRNLLQHSLNDIQSTKEQVSSYQHNESDWTFTISGSGQAGLGKDDLAAITQRALDIAPPPSQASTKTVVGVVESGGKPVADVVINARLAVHLPKNPKEPKPLEIGGPSAPMFMTRFSGNGTSNATVVPQNDPRLSNFIDRINALAQDAGVQGVNVNATGIAVDFTKNHTLGSGSLTPFRRRRRRGESDSDQVDGSSSSKINDILGRRLYFPLGNTGFAAKLWVWRDDSYDVPIVRVTKMKYFREAIQAAMNAIPLHVEANKRDKIRPYNEFEAITSQGLETVGGPDVVFSAWSFKSIYDESEKAPTKLTDYMWQQLGLGLLNLMRESDEEDDALALQGAILNTAVYGEPDGFGQIEMLCATAQELTDSDSNESDGTILLDGAAVARRML